VSPYARSTPWYINVTSTVPVSALLLIVREKIRVPPSALPTSTAIESTRTFRSPSGFHPFTVYIGNYCRPSRPSSEDRTMPRRRPPRMWTTGVRRHAANLFHDSFTAPDARVPETRYAPVGYYYWRVDETVFRATGFGDFRVIVLLGFVAGKNCRPFGRAPVSARPFRFDKNANTLIDQVGRNFSRLVSRSTCGVCTKAQ